MAEMIKKISFMMIITAILSIIFLVTTTSSTALDDYKDKLVGENGDIYESPNKKRKDVNSDYLQDGIKIYSRVEFI